MTISDPTKESCEKCDHISTIMELPPWLWDSSVGVDSGPQNHVTWCKRRKLYNIYKREPSMPDKQFIDEIVKAHNEYRSRHQVSPLSHAKDLTDYAQKWADHLVATNGFQHSDCNHKGQKLGENIAMKWSSGPSSYSGQEVTDQWYSEVKDYTFGCEPTTLKSGHFTQVVWKGSKEVGVGKAQGRDGKTIVVASYRPAGNMVGSFRENVLPPKDGKILLPVQKDNPKPSESPFSSRFDDARKGFGDSGAGKGGTETKSTRTYTVTEGSGPNAVTKTIVEETIIKPDGSKVTRRSETTSSGGDSAGAGAGFGGFKDDEFGKLSLEDRGQNRAMGARSSSPASDNDSKKNKPQKLKDFIDEAVKVHNDYRSKHGVGKVKHGKDLSDYAQRWAEKLASRNAFEHSSCDLDGERLGENICCKWSSSGADYTGREACEQWYSEISKHDFNNEPRTLGSGHFTQMVWKDCKEMGIGKAKTSGGKVIVVANYRPAGNVVGHFRENVFPPTK